MKRSRDQRSLEGGVAWSAISEGVDEGQDA